MAAFGDRNFEYSFKGTLNGKTLTGELTDTRGSQTIEGQKILLKPAKKATVSNKKTFRPPDVIFVPTPQQVVDRMLELAEVKKDDLVYDLGCGDGRIVVTAAQKYGCRGIGFDIAAKRVQESLANVASHDVGNLVRIERADIFTLDLRPADVITLYLLPSLNVKLIPQLDKLRPGVRIVSHDFDMKGVKPDKIVTIEDTEDEYGDHTIYLWTTPLNKE
ncbi:MAG: class I SAM-dependent methyltransferase [Phycisphaerae bacterium]|nr:class I SAM-dependent methyltransferase [Phycisphaerae bacterium]